MDPMQLLYYQAPLSAAMLLVLVPILEPVGNTLAHEWSLLDIVSAKENIFTAGTTFIDLLIC